MNTFLTIPAIVDCSNLSYLDGRELISAIDDARAECDFTLEIIKRFISKLRNECRNEPEEWAEIKEQISKLLN
jgi:hypothetical protein